MSLLLLIAVSCVQTLYAWESCLSCSGVVSPTDCTTVNWCGPNEDCFTDMVVNAVGGVRYNLGCRDTMQCHIRQSDSEDTGNLIVCSECCSGDICNNAGCNHKGYPSPRGPVCNHCEMQGSVNDCDKITMCAQDEVCVLKKTLSPVTHEARYLTKCQKEADCYADMNRIKQAIDSIIGKRQTQNTLYAGGCFMKCCKTDMCNNNCNSTSSSNDNVRETATGFE